MVILMNKDISKPITSSSKKASTPQHEIFRDVSFSALHKDMFSTQKNPPQTVQRRAQQCESKPTLRPSRPKSRSPNRLQVREVKGAKPRITENRSASNLPRNKSPLASFKKNQFVNCVINVHKQPKLPEISKIYGTSMKRLALSKVYH